MDDVDRLKGTGTRACGGSRLSRADMLHIALMSSENRAASAWDGTTGWPQSLYQRQ